MYEKNNFDMYVTIKRLSPLIVYVYVFRVYFDGEYMEPPGAVSLVVPNVSILSRAS